MGAVRGHHHIADGLQSITRETLAADDREGPTCDPGGTCPVCRSIRGLGRRQTCSRAPCQPPRARGTAGTALVSFVTPRVGVRVESASGVVSPRSLSFPVASVLAGHGVASGPYVSCRVPSFPVDLVEGHVSAKDVEVQVLSPAPPLTNETAAATGVESFPRPEELTRPSRAGLPAETNRPYVVVYGGVAFRPRKGAAHAFVPAENRRRGCSSSAALHRARRFRLAHRRRRGLRSAHGAAQRGRNRSAAISVPNDNGGARAGRAGAPPSERSERRVSNPCRRRMDLLEDGRVPDARGVRASPLVRSGCRVGLAATRSSTSSARVRPVPPDRRRRHDEPSRRARSLGEGRSGRAFVLTHR